MAKAKKAVKTTKAKKFSQKIKGSERNAAKAKKSSAALEALKKKDKSELTPLEKARLARASGKSKKSKKAARITFKAPSDMKPVSVRASLAFGKDGHLVNSKFTAIKGKVDSDTAKSVDLDLYDRQTASSMLARIAGPIFIKSEKKRLPAGLMLQALFRVGKSKTHGGVTVGLKEVKAKLPDKKPKALAKKDPTYRVIRKSVRPLEAAFTKMKPFPSAKELKALTSQDSET